MDFNELIKDVDMIEQIQPVNNATVAAVDSKNENVNSGITGAVRPFTLN